MPPRSCYEARRHDRVGPGFDAGSSTHEQQSPFTPIPAAKVWDAPRPGGWRRAAYRFLVGVFYNGALLGAGIVIGWALTR